MDIFSLGYKKLKGDKGDTQTGAETVAKLIDRVEHATLLEDRRAAVLGLKGLAKEYKVVLLYFFKRPMISFL